MSTKIDNSHEYKLKISQFCKKKKIQLKYVTYSKRVNSNFNLKKINASLYAKYFKLLFMRIIFENRINVRSVIKQKTVVVFIGIFKCLKVSSNGVKYITSVNFAGFLLSVKKY